MQPDAIDNITNPTGPESQQDVSPYDPLEERAPGAAYNEDTTRQVPHDISGESPSATTNLPASISVGLGPGTAHLSEPVADAPTVIIQQVPSSPESSIPSAPRRSQRTAARKPTGYYARLHNANITVAESVRDYMACHMSARECANIYGAEAQEAAGAEEIINIIGREALIPRDFRTLTKEDMDRVLPSFIFYKAKELLPSEIEEYNDEKLTWTAVISKRDKKKRKLGRKTQKIKGRWVGGGNHQKKSDALRDRVAPTARSTTHAIVLTIAAKEKRRLHVGDIPSAYLQAKHVPADGSTTFSSGMTRRPPPS